MPGSRCCPTGNRVYTTLASPDASRAAPSLPGTLLYHTQLPCLGCTFLTPLFSLSSSSFLFLFSPFLFFLFSSFCSDHRPSKDKGIHSQNKNFSQQSPHHNRSRPCSEQAKERQGETSEAQTRWDQIQSEKLRTEDSADFPGRKSLERTSATEPPTIPTTPKKNHAKNAPRTRLTKGA